jgi:hypothetical protein
VGASASYVPTKSCSNVPIAHRDVRRYRCQAGLRTHECIRHAGESPSHVLIDAVAFGSAVTRLPLRGQRRVWF